MESKGGNKGKPKNSLKKEEYDSIRDEELKKKYPGVNAHDITKNRICMSQVQLKKIFDQKDPQFNNKFLIFCERKLIEKQRVSLDFGDVAEIIDRI